jgi:glutathionyl-hydroquinone reductase
MFKQIRNQLTEKGREYSLRSIACPWTLRFVLSRSPVLGVAAAQRCCLPAQVQGRRGHSGAEGGDGSGDRQHGGVWPGRS